MHSATPASLPLSSSSLSLAWWLSVWVVLGLLGLPVTLVPLRRHSVTLRRWLLTVSLHRLLLSISLHGGLPLHRRLSIGLWHSVTSWGLLTGHWLSVALHWLPVTHLRLCAIRLGLAVATGCHRLWCLSIGLGHTVSSWWLLTWLLARLLSGLLRWLLGWLSWGRRGRLNR